MKLITSRLFSFFCLSAFLYFSSLQVAGAKVLRTEHGELATRLGLPVHQWQDDRQSPKAVVLAIHGLTLHGTCFDAYARKLATQGFIVVAPDLRGYGDWFESDKKAKISYRKSQQDVTRLAGELRSRYGRLPLFCSGESLGGSMTIHVAAANPQLFDGIILSAPGIKMVKEVPLKTVLSSLNTVVNPWHRIDLSPYLNRCMPGQEPEKWEASRDRLVRLRLSAAELYSSIHFVESTAKDIGELPPTLPVLVMHGKLDRVVSLAGTRLLERKLKSQDQTLKIFDTDGHILLERHDIADRTMRTVSTWLNQHCAASQNVHLAAGPADSSDGNGMVLAKLQQENSVVQAVPPANLQASP